MTPELFQYAIPSAFSFLGLIITAIAGPIVLSRLNRQDQELKVVRDHVANTHTTNLRDDLDGVGAKIDRVIDSLNMERAERRADTRGMRQEIQFIREDIVGLKESDNSLWGALKQKVRGDIPD